MNVGRTKRGECIYCGHFGTVDGDHVVSRCLFDGLPNDNSVVIVPSCRVCQQDKSNDEAYFAHRMMSDHRVSNHPVATKLAYSKMLRAAKTHRSDLVADFLRTREPIYLETQSGIDIGLHHRAVISKPRLVNVARYIVRGLYFDMMGRRLPDGYSAHASEDGAESTNPLLTQARVHEILPHMVYEKRIGNVFSAYGSPTVEDSGLSLWLLLFYGKIAYLGMTLNDNLSVSG